MKERAMILNHFCIFFFGYYTLVGLVRFTLLKIYTPTLTLPAWSVLILKKYKKNSEKYTINFNIMNLYFYQNTNRSF